jgi:CheY-like chemotaxis protein
MGAEHILFIDDEESLVSVTRSMLEHLGYTVTTFSNPLDCMESFPANMSQFSVIISDHLMPEMNGIDLLVRLREINSSIPVILCTGHADPEIKSQLQEMGCSGLVTKPYTLPQLGETVRRVLDNAAIEL